MNKDAENVVIIYAKAITADVVSSAEDNNGTIKVDENTDSISAGMYTCIYDLNGQLLLGKRTRPEIDNLSQSYEDLRKININDDVWLVYDQPVYDENKLIAWARIGHSMSSVNAALDNLKTIVIASIPIFVLISIIGGFFFAKKALSPINYITKKASIIGKDDLSQRLNLTEVDDEVGRLAVTFDKMLDRLEDSFKIEQQFTSDVSHELRTPLSVISAIAEETLAGNKSSQNYKNAMKQVFNETKKMKYMVSQLLMLNENDEKRYKLEIEEIEMDLIIQDVLDSMRSISDRNEIQLLFEGGAGLKVMADRTLIISMLINLIDNAIKYNNDKGWVRVAVLKKQEQDYAEISIEDNGIGIPEDSIPYIFNRFYRVDKSRTGEGIGLGLSIVKWIVEMHKGIIRIDSKIGQGTIVNVLLPMKQSVKHKQSDSLVV